MFNMKLVNKYQTKEERKLKYQICLELGLSWQYAQILRDWNFSSIIRYFKECMKLEIEVSENDIKK